MFEFEHNCKPIYLYSTRAILVFSILRIVYSISILPARFVNQKISVKKIGTFLKIQRPLMPFSVSNETTHDWLLNCLLPTFTL